MSRWQSIAGLFIMGVRDFDYSVELKSLLKDFPVSGIALFNSPFDGPSNLWNDPDTALEALHEFLNRIYEHNVFLCVDQEGGRVRRFRKPFIQLPPAHLLGEAFEEQEIDSDKLFEIYQLEAQQLLLAGISLNFAPCVDLHHKQGNDVIGDRSFSERIDTVITMAKVYCEAYRSVDLNTCLKHLPGHGSASFDSHEKIAVLQKTKEEVLQRDFKIFQELGSFASSVMTAHIAFPHEEDRVFSLDADLFREFKNKMPTHLRFITDDLVTMKSVSEDDPAWKTLQAGYDFSLLCGDLNENLKHLESATRQMEGQDISFQNEQDWERRIRHSREAFEPCIKPPPFKKWKKSILDLTKTFQDTTQALKIFEDNGA